MKNKQRYARLAGFLYLVVIICGVFAELVVRHELVVPGDGTTTAGIILDHEAYWRWGFVADMTMITAFFFLPFAFYQVFKTVSRAYATVMVISALMAVAIMSMNMIHHIGVLLVLKGGYMAPGMDAGSLVALMVDLHKHGYRIAQVFFGIWLYPLGYLVWKSGWVPRILGWMLMIACGSFLIDFILFFTLREYGVVTSSWITLPTTLAEFSICLWMLLRGVRFSNYRAPITSRPATS